MRGVTARTRRQHRIVTGEACQQPRRQDRDVVRGRSQPSIVIDVQLLVTHAASVATMEREMGHPPRHHPPPGRVCYLFQARDEERLPGLVDRWESYGIAAQVVQIPPMGGPSTRY